MESVSENTGIGSQLKAAREAQSATIDDISALLKIRSDHLEALENDDFDRLPGHVYAIGFIRTYATHLGLNASELVNLFKEATLVLPLDDGAYNDAGGEPLSLGLKLGLGFFALFLVYLMWLIAGGAGTQERQSQASAPSAEKTLSAEQQAAPKKAAQIASPPQRPAPKALAETSGGADTSGATPALDAGEPVQPVGETQAVDVAALAAPQQSGETVQDDEGQDNAAVAAARIEPIVLQNVQIRASRRTWMRIENAEGTVLFSSIIRDGDYFELEDDTPYTLATRDAGALHYYVDETKVGNVGRRGQILTARQIDRAAIIAMQP